MSVCKCREIGTAQLTTAQDRASESIPRVSVSSRRRAYRGAAAVMT